MKRIKEVPLSCNFHLNCRSKTLFLYDVLYLEADYPLFVSNSRHGTHSPFVYALADQVIYVPSATCRQRTILPEGFSAGYRDLLADILSHWSIPNLTEYPELVNTSAVWVPRNLSLLASSSNLLAKVKLLLFTNLIGQNTP